MKEFEKCNFCERYGEIDENVCSSFYCVDYSDYRTNADKVLKKADELKISVTDVLNLIHECNR